MNSNYLNEKYPNEGYKKPIAYPTSKYAKKLPWEKQSRSDYLKEQAEREEVDLLIKEYEKINQFSCTNVCRCGEEWEDRYAKYQEGCYPYIEKTCRKCGIAKEVESRKRQQEAKQKSILDNFDSLIPPRYRGKLGQPRSIDLLKSNCSIIWGGFGTGKTWEGYSIAKELIKIGEIKTFNLLTEIDLLNDLKADFDYMNSKIDRYKNVDLLILDEAGKNNDSDFNKAQMFGILNYRYDWEKKTILICNAKQKEEIRELLPTSILDRFRECVVEMNGQSRRYGNT